MVVIRTFNIYYCSPQFEETGIETEILPKCLGFQAVRVYFV
jgi:hypothetical protein